MGHGIATCHTRQRAGELIVDRRLGSADRHAKVSQPATPAAKSHRASASVNPAKTQVVTIGTGTPIPDPSRHGACTAVVHASQAYLFDAGEGAVRGAARAATTGIEALEPTRLNRLFLTHLHSDHTLGVADLILTPWANGRRLPLHIWGPPGTRTLVDKILLAYADDIQEHIQSLPEFFSGKGPKVIVKEINDNGLVWSDDSIRIEAYETPHGEWDKAFCYKVTTRSGTVVISGDTVPSASVKKAATDCDLLVHEAYSSDALPVEGKEFADYVIRAHTSARELGLLAALATPRSVVLTHQTTKDTVAARRAIAAEVETLYRGPVFTASDGDVFEIADVSRMLGTERQTMTRRASQDAPGH